MNDATSRPGKDGGPPRLSEREVARLAQAFEEGLAPTAAHATMKGVSLSTVRRAHRAWRATRATKPIDDARAAAVERTLAFAGIEMLPTPRSVGGEAHKQDRSTCSARARLSSVRARGS
jgi:hypothetical protein